MNAEEKLDSIRGILSILKIEDHHTSKKQLQNALKEIDKICKSKPSTTES